MDIENWNPLISRNCHKNRLLGPIPYRPRTSVSFYCNSWHHLVLCSQHRRIYASTNTLFWLLLILSERFPMNIPQFDSNSKSMTTNPIFTIFVVIFDFIGFWLFAEKSWIGRFQKNALLSPVLHKNWVLFKTMRGHGHPISIYQGICPLINTWCFWYVLCLFVVLSVYPTKNSLLKE